jgi:hypothetical protein
MKNLKTYLILFTALVILSTACTKKKSEATPEPVPPPVVVTPPTSTVVTGFTISQSLNQTVPKYDLESTIIYSSSSQEATGFKQLPATYNDNIKSFNLPKGYMAVFSENQNGTGESICYVAVTSDVSENLPSRLVGKVSYVRFLPYRNVNKKGVCQTNINDVNASKASWFYNWGLGATSTATQHYVPMTWGKGSANATTALNFIARTDIDHYLSFNEPDGSNQSNIPNIDEAVTGYRTMLQTGLRMVSPAVEQDNSTGANRWLTNFVTAANAQKARIDVIALHWYDWGNQNSNLATDELTANAALNRFKNYIAKVHAAYPNQALWFTEYNCNPGRSIPVQKIFMKASAEYLNTLPYVERYAYFFNGTNFPLTSGAPNHTLTDVGQTWLNIESPPAFTNNIIPN